MTDSKRGGPTGDHVWSSGPVALAEHRAVDTHAHVFWAHSPRIADARYQPGYEATVADYLAQLDVHDIAHGILVQPSFLGTGNSCLLRSLTAGRGRLSGIAVIDPGMGARSLYDMAMRGVRGIRLNLIGRPVPDLVGSEWREMLMLIRDMGWVVTVQAIADQWPRVLRYLLSLQITVVVDHMGRPAMEDPFDCPGFQAILHGLGTGRVWVKLSAPYRFGFQRAARAAAILLEQAGPERLLWGSDWPWTQHELDGHSYEDCRAWLTSWVPDAETRRRILCETPRILFNLPG